MASVAIISPTNGTTVTSNPTFSVYWDFIDIAYPGYDWLYLYLNDVQAARVYCYGDKYYTTGDPKSGVSDITSSTGVWSSTPTGTVTCRVRLEYGVGSYVETTIQLTKGGLSKPTTPTPANGSGPGINFTDRTLSWVNGGGSTGYRVKFPFANAIDVGANTSYVIPESMIPSFNQTTVSWRVDATDGTDWVTGDTWTFDPRPAKVTTPSPENSATSINKALDKMSWTASTYADKHIITSSFSSGTIELEGAELVLATYTPTTLNPLGYSKTYTWSVDANNVWGTTEGDNWTFTTENLTFPRAIYYYPGTGFYYLIWDDDTQTWGDPPPVGTIDVDYHVVTYVNFIASHRRLVAASADQLWYESL